MRSFKKKHSFIFVICGLVLSFCFMQKGLYTKGFYAFKNQKNKRHETIFKADTLQKLKIENLTLEYKNIQLMYSITESNKSFILRAHLNFIEIFHMFLL